MTSDQLSRLLARRERLTNRRDGRINVPAVNEIDAQLAQVPPGQSNAIDLVLGRSCAVLPDRWSTDEQRAAWKQQAEQTGAELAKQKRDEFLQWCADQTEDYFDFLGIRGNTAI